MEIGKILLERYSKLVASRHNWDSHWEEISNYIIPQKDNIYGYNTKGEEKHNLLFDGTSIHVNELLASALHGLLTNPSVHFFNLTTRDAELDASDDVRNWVQVCVRKIHQVLSDSNFHTEIYEVYLDLGSFGTSTLRVLEDPKVLIRFEARPIYESYIQENNLGIIDTVYRKFKWTAKQILEEFYEEFDEIEEGGTGPLYNIKQKVHSDPSCEYEIIHAVFPREEKLTNKDSGIDTPKRFTYASFYLLVEGAHVLRESGFNEFPYAVPRWSKISGEVYGRSPGMKALPDIKMLNQVMKTTIRAAQLVIAPPLQVPDDGSRRAINMRPNGINYYRAGSASRIEPILTNARVDFADQFMEGIRLRIRQAFFIDQLQLNEGPQMTATEVIQRTEEKVRLLAPILSRLNSELLSPLVERVFAILLRKGELPEAPSVLSGKKMEVVYSSTIAKAQKTSEADIITRLLSVAAPFIQSDPTMMDNFDGDKIIRYLGLTLEAPNELFRDQKDVGELREARIKQQQEQMQQQQMMEQAETLSKLQGTQGV